MPPEFGGHSGIGKSGEKSAINVRRQFPCPAGLSLERFSYLTVYPLHRHGIISSQYQCRLPLSQVSQFLAGSRTNSRRESRFWEVLLTCTMHIYFTLFFSTNSLLSLSVIHVNGTTPLERVSSRIPKLLPYLHLHRLLCHPLSQQL